MQFEFQSLKAHIMQIPEPDLSTADHACPLLDKKPQISPLRYASVEMTIHLAVAVCKGGFRRTEGRTADPSAALRFGRDDKFAWEG